MRHAQLDRADLLASPLRLRDPEACLDRSSCSSRYARSSWRSPRSACARGCVFNARFPHFAEGSYSYVYDSSGRLYQVSINGTLASTYSYDADGNRLSLNSTSGTYDAQDRMLTYGSNAYTYDDNGELASITVCPGTPSPTCSGGSTTSYIYDILGNLREVTPPSLTPVIDYMIDGKNRRIGKKVAGTLVQGFLYDEGQRVLAELDATGAVKSQFVYGTKPITPDYMINGGNTYRIVSDMLGSVRLVVNASTGAIAQEMDYDEFGNVTHDSSPGFQPFGFAGGIYDRDTGFVKFGARDYDPVSGRWISKDLSRFSGGPNLYVYAENNPVALVDPTGHAPFDGGDSSMQGPHDPWVVGQGECGDWHSRRNEHNRCPAGPPTTCYIPNGPTWEQDGEGLSSILGHPGIQKWRSSDGDECIYSPDGNLDLGDETYNYYPSKWNPGHWIFDFYAHFWCHGGYEKPDPTTVLPCQPPPCSPK